MFVSMIKVVLTAFQYIISRCHVQTKRYISIIRVKDKCGNSLRNAGPGGTPNFPAYVGSDPASTIHPKNIRNFKHPPKNILNFSNPKKYPHSVQ